MQLRSVLNRMLFTVAPGLGQILDGHWIVGGLVAFAAAGTLVAAEAANTQYRKLQFDYRKLNLPPALLSELGADRQRSLARLAGIYLVLGLVSAALYRDDATEDELLEPQPPEEP